MFYINMYVLVPAIFFKARYVLYLVLVIMLVLAGFGAMNCIKNTYLEQHSIGKLVRLNQFEGIMVSIPVILVTTTVKLLQRWTKDNQQWQSYGRLP